MFTKIRLFTIVLFIGVIIAGVVTKRYIEKYSSDFIVHTINSSVLKEQRKIFIRLPDNYDPSKNYPLIIKTDGNFNLSRWDETLKLLSASGNVEDSILVAIPNLFWTDTRNRDLVPPYARKEVNIDARLATDNHPEIFGRADKFLAFIETEVLSYIETTFSTNENRVLVGYSAGGSFVLYTIVNKPSLFTGYFAFSPAAWYDNSVVVDNFKAELSKTHGKPLFMYLSIGSEENDIITGSFNGLLQAIAAHAPNNLYTKHSFNEGADHGTNPYVSVPKALNAYYEFYNLNK